MIAEFLKKLWSRLKCDHENSRVLCEAHEDYLFICLDCGKEFWGD